MKKIKEIVKRGGALLPLRIALIFSAVVGGIGCFLGFEKDGTMFGIFCLVAAAMMAVEFWFEKEKKNNA